MDMTRRSFTVKSGGILRQLITPCFAWTASRHGGASSIQTSKQFNSLWDTRATSSMITRRVVAALGLQPETYMYVQHAGGQTKDVPFYYIDLLLYNNVRIADLRVGLVEVRDFELLLGMDIISPGDFAVSNRNGATAFSFRIPSIEDFDFVAADSDPA